MLEINKRCRSVARLRKNKLLETPSIMKSLSSGNIKLGISPVFNKLFRFSIKLSLIIYVSVNTNEMP